MHKFSEYVELINENLFKYLPKSEGLQKTLAEAMKYTLLAGGKRIRPVLTLAFCEACGGDLSNALPFACAIEMIHSYSLIHDDLPCMDNDDLRRGIPSNHVKFGEATALLAGDALLTRAFEIILCNETTNLVGAKITIDAASCLARNIGFYGMIGGQVADLENSEKNVNCSKLNEIHNLKTGALIVAASKIGCIVANASKVQIEAAAEYAESIGLAFQIMDDVLDGDSKDKKIEKRKLSYASVLETRKSKEIVKKLTQEAIKSLNVFGDNRNFFENLAWQLSKRDK